MLIGKCDFCHEEQPLIMIGDSSDLIATCSACYESESDTGEVW